LLPPYHRHLYHLQLATAHSAGPQLHVS